MQFVKLVQLRKTHKVWSRIISLQSAVCTKNEIFTLKKFLFSVAQMDKSLLNRALLVSLRKTKRLLPGSSDYISPEEELKFEKTLFQKSRNYYCLYRLAKMYQYIRNVHKVEMKKFIGWFYFNGTDFFLADIEIIDFVVLKYQFEEIFGVVPRDLMDNIPIHNSPFRSPSIRRSVLQNCILELDKNNPKKDLKSSFFFKMKKSVNGERQLADKYALIRKYGAHNQEPLDSLFSIRRDRLQKKSQNPKKSQSQSFYIKDVLPVHPLHSGVLPVHHKKNLRKQKFHITSKSLDLSKIKSQYSNIRLERNKMYMAKKAANENNSKN